MAVEEALDRRTYVAAGNLAADQFRFVVVNTGGQVEVNSTAGGRCLGVLQEKPAGQGEVAEVAVRGTSKMVAGAAVAAGDLVASDNGGRAVTAGTGASIMGQARRAAADAGAIISVELGYLGEAS